MPGLTPFLLATVGALGCYVGLLATLDGGLLRRILLSACLLWIVGWIAVAPSLSTRVEGSYYLASVLAGGLLIGVVTLFSRLDIAVAEGRLSAAGRIRESRSRCRYTVLAGGAFAVPGAIGLLFGGEVLFLAFVVAAAVAVILLFLFR